MAAAPTVLAETSRGYKFTFSSGKAVIVKYTGSDIDVTIPDTLGGCPVCGIDEYAFFGSNLTGINIPDSVTSIGDYENNRCSDSK